MVVGFSTEKLVAVMPPNLTCPDPVRWVPVIVIAVPPVVVPEAGVSEVIVGTGET